MASNRFFLLDTRGNVPGYCNRAEHLTLVILHHRERHFDVKLLTCPADRTGQRCAAMQSCTTTCHRGFEAAPVRGSQMFRDDQIEILT